ncbi:glycosyltransferase family 2 protein [Dialister invisus]|uniref:glycosyltransferase family 2 protein n=1 Tax=Dialister invisus TaxID=218538 RepID=UPI00265AD610|nr:glycosyltransferase family A protein [Dialister invisus]
MKPKITVIVPIYNTEKYLAECLDSICKQTLKDIEILCINDGSPDDSLYILRRYEYKAEKVIKNFLYPNKSIEAGEDD